MLVWHWLCHAHGCIMSHAMRMVRNGWWFHKATMKQWVVNAYLVRFSAKKLQGKRSCTNDFKLSWWHHIFFIFSDSPCSRPSSFPPLQHRIHGIIIITCFLSRHYCNFILMYTNVRRIICKDTQESRESSSQYPFLVGYQTNPDNWENAVIYNDTHTGNMSPLNSSCSCLIALLAAKWCIEWHPRACRRVTWISSGIDRGFDNRDYTRSHIVWCKL